MVLRHVLYRYFHLESKFQQNCYFWTFLAIFGHFWWFFQGSSLWNVKNPIQITTRFSKKKKVKIFCSLFCSSFDLFVFFPPYTHHPESTPEISARNDDFWRGSQNGQTDRQTDTHTDKQTDRQLCFYNIDKYIVVDHCFLFDAGCTW